MTEPTVDLSTLTAPGGDDGEPAAHDARSEGNPVGPGRGFTVPAVVMVAWFIDAVGQARTVDCAPSQRAAVGVATLDLPRSGFIATRRLPQPAALDDGFELAGIMLADVGWRQITPWRGSADAPGCRVSSWVHPDVGVNSAGQWDGPIHAPVSDPVGGLGDRSLPPVLARR